MLRQHYGGYELRDCWPRHVHAIWELSTLAAEWHRTYSGSRPDLVRALEFYDRWLPGTKAADLMLPGADCWVFDHRVVRWNFQRGDGTNPRHYTFSSDPRTIRDIVAAFELAWNRATPHAE